MAIKVNGTTVIDDSRNISNVGTVTATSFSGNGSALTGIDTAPPTTFGDVGTYAFLYYTTTVVDGTTYAGSGLYPAGIFNWNPIGGDSFTGGTDAIATRGPTAVSGTWRAMGRVNWSSAKVSLTLFVRIS